VRERGLFMDDEKDFSGVRCDVRLIVGPRARQRKLSQSLAVRCSVRCAYAKTADQIRIRITADWDNLIKFSEPHQSRSTRRETGPNRHPVQTRRLMRSQRRTPRWSHHPMRRMIGKAAEAASCAWEGFVRTCGESCCSSAGEISCSPKDAEVGSVKRIFVGVDAGTSTGSTWSNKYGSTHSSSSL
jgi:hypothetical protein